MTDQQVSLAIGALSIDPTGQVIYAGTGELNNCGDCQGGQGILKSTDGGTTWSVLSGSSGLGTYIGGLAIDRTTSGMSQHVFAATASPGCSPGCGIYESKDGGVTWSQAASAAGVGSTVVVQDPTNSAIFYATRSDATCSTSYGAILVSTDGGSSWVAQLVSSPAASRIGLGAGPGGVVYAALADCPNGKLISLEKSTNYGSTWTAINLGTAQGLTDYFTNPIGHISQGWYDNVVAVDPNNSSNAVFGGIDVLVTQNGGSNFTNVTDSYNLGGTGGFVHPDTHAILLTPTRKTSMLWVGNDGGIYQSTDLGGSGLSSDWTNRNTNLNGIQFYQGTALSAARYLGGSQDNGTSGNLPGAAALPSWQGYWVGDGGFTAIDPNSDAIYAENPPAGGQSLSIYRGHSTLTSSALSPYNSFTLASPCSGVNAADPACTEPAAWTPPFAMDPTNPLRLVATTNRLYETTSGGTPAGTAGYTSNGSWSVKSPSLTSSSNGFITAIAMGPPGQTGIIFTGSSDGTLYMTPDDGATWIRINGTGIPTGASITGVAFNSFNPAEAWISTGNTTNGVYHTVNAGTSTTWTAMAGITARPNSIVPDRVNPAILYVGTDLGVVVCTTCGGSGAIPNWAPFGTGLPNVQVLALNLTRDGKNVVAWTHGRGTWIAPVLPAPCLTQTIAGGIRHSLVVATNGLVYAWGGGTSGQLGLGFNSDTVIPTHVSLTTGIPNVSSVAAGGFHSVALGVNGTVWTWGDNSSGGLGNSNYPNGSNVPVQVQGVNGSGYLTGINYVSAGDYNFSVAIRASDGSVWTWGDNAYGQLGNQSLQNSPTPVQVKGPGGVGFLTGIIQVSAGNNHIVALRSDGTVWAWGINAGGELGNGKASSPVSTPVQVVASSGKGFLIGVIAVGTTSDTSLAVVTNGSVYSWGNNNYGQLGNNTSGTGTFSATPVQVSVLSGLALNPSVTEGTEHGLAADPSSGSAWGWGWNVYGQVGDGSQTERNVPVPIKTTAQITEVAAGAWHSLGLAADGTLWTWGYNYYGQLGNGSNGTNVYPTPAPISESPFNAFTVAQRRAC